MEKIQHHRGTLRRYRRYLALKRELEALRIALLWDDPVILPERSVYYGRHDEPTNVKLGAVTAPLTQELEEAGNEY